MRSMPDIFKDAASYYTDLMSERGRAAGEGVEFKSSLCSVGVWERVRITDEAAAQRIGRPRGHYHTLTTERFDLMDSYTAAEASEEIARELLALCECSGLSPTRILAVGLGNEELTPDALGPSAAIKIEATMHLGKVAPEMLAALGCTEIAVLRPGVCAQSGMESRDTVCAVCERIKPDLVIAIDALCARSEDRLGCTVQISDTGVFPGSGVGNPRDAICEDSVGCPVIAIGIPTVIDAGIISNRKEGERMLVTPREINATVKCGADVISDAINRAFGVVR